MPSFTPPTDLDPRLTPARADLAASWLKDKVKADRYVDPKRQSITVGVANLYRAKGDLAAPMETQFLYGEAVDVFEAEGGWSWLQAVRDGYVGYMPDHHLGAMTNAEPTHRVSNSGAFVYPVATIKATPSLVLPYGSQITVKNEKDGMMALESGGFVPQALVAPIDFTADDVVAETFRFLGVPYLWGGKSQIGIDCSALIQLVLHACGLKCPRDSDLQEKTLGKPIDRDAVQGGDLVFFRGHVGMMGDETTMIHANDRAMAVSIDDLDEYSQWRSKNGKTPVRIFKRIG